MSLSISREWLIQVPILPDSIEKRLATREQHLNEAKRKIEDGIITFAGGILASPTIDGDNKEMTVTLFIVTVDTEEEARRILENDIYSTSGIWDVKGAQIFPFMTSKLM
jgi:uncharacterized protein YciI